MKVILTARVKGLGEMGTVEVVKDGYGRNYLIPQNLAIPYSAKNYETFEARRQAIEKEDEARKSKAQENRKKVEAKELIIIENAGDNDKLYGSINTHRIANLINELIGGEDIKKSEILIKTPIKTLGKFEVILELHPEVSFSKEVYVVRSMEEYEKVKNEQKAIKADSIKAPAKKKTPKAKKETEEMAEGAEVPASEE